MTFELNFKRILHQAESQAKGSFSTEPWRKRIRGRKDEWPQEQWGGDLRLSRTGLLTPEDEGSHPMLESVGFIL